MGWSMETGEWGAVNDQGVELTGLSMTASVGALEKLTMKLVDNLMVGVKKLGVQMMLMGLTGFGFQLV